MFVVLSWVLHVIKLDTLLAEFVKCPQKGTPCPWEPAWKCYQCWKHFSLLNSRSKLHYRPTIKFDNYFVDRVLDTQQFGFTSWVNLLDCKECCKRPTNVVFWDEVINHYFSYMDTKNRKDCLQLALVEVAEIQC